MRCYSFGNSNRPCCYLFANSHVPVADSISSSSGKSQTCERGSSFRKVLFVCLLLLLFSFEHTCFVYHRVNPFFFYLACAPSNRQPRQSPFSRMGAGPFHSPMGAMGGMGHMSPAMGGPSMGGQSRGNAGSMFTTTVGLGCVRHEIVCPNWCLAVDANGCKSCPCGPGMICFQCYVHFSSSLWEIFINTMYTYIE